MYHHTMLYFFPYKKLIYKIKPFLLPSLVLNKINNVQGSCFLCQSEKLRGTFIFCAKIRLALWQMCIFSRLYYYAILYICMRGADKFVKSVQKIFAIIIIPSYHFLAYSIIPCCSTRSFLVQTIELSKLPKLPNLQSIYLPGSTFYWNHTYFSDGFLVIETYVFLT